MPALLLTVSNLVAAYLVAVKRGYAAGTFPGWGMVARSFAASLPGLFVVVLILGGILSGVFTATESAAVAVLYALFLCVVVYRTLKWEQFLKAAAKAVKTTGVVLLLIGISAAFGYIISLYEVPELTGKLLPWIDLVATYAYVDAKVTNSNVAVTGIPIGTQLSEAPRHSASLFTKIAFEPLGLPDTAVSVGVYYLGRRPTRDYFSPPDPSVTFYSATTRIDLGIYQQISPKLRVQGNITNLTSERIYEPANQGYRRAQPFRATVGVRVTL